VGRQSTVSHLGELERTLTGVLETWNASHAGEPREGADETLRRIYGEGGSSAGAGDGGVRPDSTGSGGAGSSGGGSHRCSSGTVELSPDPRRGRTYFVVEWEDGAVLVVGHPTPLTDSERRSCGTPLGCVRAILLDPSGKGYRVVTSDVSLGVADRKRRELCGG
jgi:hypothetical protein